MIWRDTTLRVHRPAQVVAERVPQCYQYQQHADEQGACVAEVKQGEVIVQKLAAPASADYAEHGSRADVVLPPTERIAHQLRQEGRQALYPKALVADAPQVREGFGLQSRSPRRARNRPVELD